MCIGVYSCMYVCVCVSFLINRSSQPFISSSSFSFLLPHLILYLSAVLKLHFLFLYLCFFVLFIFCCFCFIWDRCCWLVLVLLLWWRRLVLKWSLLPATDMYLFYHLALKNIFSLIFFIIANFMYPSLNIQSQTRLMSIRTIIWNVTPNVKIIHHVFFFSPSLRPDNPLSFRIHT